MEETNDSHGLFFSQEVNATRTSRWRTLSKETNFQTDWSRIQCLLRGVTGGERLGDRTSPPPRGTMKELWEGVTSWVRSLLEARGPETKERKNLGREATGCRCSTGGMEESQKKRPRVQL